MVYLLYDLVLLAAALVLIPFYLIRGALGGKGRQGIRERLGFYAAERLAPLAGRPVIWVHAVSVGETRAAIPLIKGLRHRYPQHALLISNVTETGHAISEGIAEVDLALYFPFDHSSVVRRILARIRPELIVIVETEIWPNFVRQAHRLHIPLALVNGRISDRSYPRYRKVRRWLQPLLGMIDTLCMQSAADAERMLAMGGPAARVVVTGNVKFDMTPPQDTTPAAELRQRLALSGFEQVWVAGSTHDGEEAQLLAVQQRLSIERSLGLVLVPRHPQRCDEVARLLSEQAIPFVRRSTLGETPEPLPPGGVLLVDTLGEMLKMYRLADVVFVGGSFVPVGGHNILEASLVGKPVLFGPYMHNFREIAALVAACGGGEKVADAEVLTAVLQRYLANPAEAARVGAAGFALLQENCGATRATLDRLACLLEPPA